MGNNVPPVGETIRGYKFLEQSGKGSFGVVYKCKYLQNKSIVAIKIISRSFPE